MGNRFEIWVWTYVSSIDDTSDKMESYWNIYHATEDEEEAFAKLKEVRALKTYGCVKLEIRESQNWSK